MSEEQDQEYINGYHPSVFKVHNMRTADNSCQFLLPTLRAKAKENPTLSFLDVGCGPGTITASLARLAPEATFTALDLSPEALAPARENAKLFNATNVTFVAGDTYALPFPSDHFDMVHAQQLLQHLRDPIAAVKEMIRVCKPGGTVALREGDVPAVFFYPDLPGLHRCWDVLCKQLADGPPGRVSRGREMRKWVRGAGIEDRNLRLGAGTWCFSSDEERRVFGEAWMERVVSSDYATKSIEQGLATREELDEIRGSWKQWIEDPDGWMCVPHAEALISV